MGKVLLFLKAPLAPVAAHIVATNSYSVGGFFAGIFSSVVGLLLSPIAIILFYITVSIPLIIIGALSNAFGFLFGQPFMNWMLTGSLTHNTNIFIDKFNFSFTSPLGHIMIMVFFLSMILLAAVFILFMYKVNLRQKGMSEQEIDVKLAWRSRIKWVAIWILVLFWVPLIYFFLTIIINGLNMLILLAISGSTSGVIMGTEITKEQFLTYKSEVITQLEAFKTQFPDALSGVSAQNATYNKIFNANSQESQALMGIILEKYDLLVNQLSPTNINEVIDGLNKLTYNETTIPTKLLESYNDIIKGNNNIATIVGNYVKGEVAAGGAILPLNGNLATQEDVDSIQKLFNISTLINMQVGLGSFNTPPYGVVSTNGDFSGSSLSNFLNYQNGSLSNSNLSVLLYQMETQTSGQGLFTVPISNLYNFTPWYIINFTSVYPLNNFMLLLVGLFINYGILILILKLIFVLLSRIAKIIWFAVLSSLYAINSIWDNGTEFNKALIEVIHEFFSLLVFCFVWSIFMVIVLPCTKAFTDILGKTHFNSGLAAGILPGLMGGMFIMALLYTVKDVYSKLLASISQNRFNVDSAMINAQNAKSQIGRSKNELSQRVGKVGKQIGEPTKGFAQKVGNNRAEMRKSFDKALGSEKGFSMGEGKDFIHHGSNSDKLKEGYGIHKANSKAQAKNLKQASSGNVYARAAKAPLKVGTKALAEMGKLAKNIFKL